MKSKGDGTQQKSQVSANTEDTSENANLKLMGRNIAVSPDGMGISGRSKVLSDTRSLSAEDTANIPKQREVETIFIDLDTDSERSTGLVPHSHDVLCGRGGATAKHPGNKVFRSWVQDRRRNYKVGSTKEKRKLTNEVLKLVRSRSPPGKFLRLDLDCGWVEISDSEAAKKTSQALRENLKPSNSMDATKCIHLKERPQRSLRAQRKQEIPMAVHDPRLVGLLSGSGKIYTPRPLSTQDFDRGDRRWIQERIASQRRGIPECNIRAFKKPPDPASSTRPTLWDQLIIAANPSSLSKDSRETEVGRETSGGHVAGRREKALVGDNSMPFPPVGAHEGRGGLGDGTALPRSQGSRKRSIDNTRVDYVTGRASVSKLDAGYETDIDEIGCSVATGTPKTLTPRVHPMHVGGNSWFTHSGPGSLTLKISPIVSAKKPKVVTIDDEDS